MTLDHWVWFKMLSPAYFILSGHTEYPKKVQGVQNGPISGKSFWQIVGTPWTIKYIGGPNSTKHVVGQ